MNMILKFVVIVLIAYTTYKLLEYVLETPVVKYLKDTQKWKNKLFRIAGEFRIENLEDKNLEQLQNLYKKSLEVLIKEVQENASNWNSLLLDGTFQDDTILSLYNDHKDQLVVWCNDTLNDFPVDDYTEFQVLFDEINEMIRCLSDKLKFLEPCLIRIIQLRIAL